MSQTPGAFFGFVVASSFITTIPDPPFPPLPPPVPPGAPRPVFAD